MPREVKLQYIWGDAKYFLLLSRNNNSDVNYHMYGKVG